MEDKKIFKLSGIGEVNGKPQRLTRIRARVGLSIPEEDKILTISLPINERGEVELPSNIDSKATIVDAKLETNQGENLQKLDIDGFQVGSIDGINFPTFNLSPDVLDLIKPTEIKPNSNWSRKGKFSVLGQADYRFEGYNLFAYAVKEEKLTKIIASHQIEAEGTQSWLHISDKIQTTLTQEQYRNGTIGFDGTFSIDLAVQDTSVGWVWIITGPITVMGFREDDHTLEKDTNIAIILPANAIPSTSASDSELEHSVKKPSVLPLDATEQQLIEHAELFNDDPGQFCQPFKNPERILGERRFSTILRVDQPEIAASAEILAKRQADRISDAAEDVVSDLLSNPSDTNVTDGITLPGVNSGVRNLSAGNLSNFFSSPLAKEKRRKGRQVPSGLTLIDWEGGTTGNQAVSVARGHILEWRIRWRSNGYSLGNIAHTLTLAPRQIKRIMKVDFARRESAIRKETLQSSDAVDQSTDSSRDYHNALSATLSEWSKGSSKSSSTGVSASAGFSMAGFGVSGGVSHGTSRSSSAGSGARDAASAEEQNVRDSIRQHGESIRALESTIVTEVSQEENVEVVSEVISNPNYCHSLTVVYYNILRHLRVDTELGGLSECLFVPFAITPFHEIFTVNEKEVRAPNLQRLIRYRDVFNRYLKKRRLKWVLRYLDDYKNQFKDINGTVLVPEGKRSDQKLTSLRGVLSIKLDIRSPLNGDEDVKAFEEINKLKELSENMLKTALVANVTNRFNQSFKPYAKLLGKSIADISARLAVLTPEEREIAFQKEVAPNIARAFCNNLKIRAKGVDNGDLEADFTLDTHYKQGKTHKVYFTAAREKIETISRDNIVEVIIDANDYVLPLYSVANVTGARISFSTEYYKDSRSTGRMVDDLVEIPNVIISPSEDTPGSTMDNVSAKLSFPTTAWEEQNLRDAIKRDIFKLTDHIDSHLHYYHKAIWWSMDHDELYTLLDGYVISENNSRSIASVVERLPLAILGNTLVFRVARGATIDSNEKSLEELFDDYSDKGRKSEPMRISLPTGGLYAQALMDECEACEEHFGSTDWVLERDEVMPQEIDAGLLTSRRAEPQNLTPTNLPDSIINIQNSPAAPAPSGTQGILGAVSNPNSFRDMTGLAGTQTNAGNAMQNASAIASQAGSLATHSLLESKRIDAITAALKRSQAKEDKGEVPQGTTKNMSESVGLGVPKLTVDPSLMPNKGLSIAEAALMQGKNFKVRTTTADGETDLEVRSNEGSENNSTQIHHNITPVKQSKENSCWAAAATTMLNWQLKESNSEEEVLEIAGVNIGDDNYYVEIFNKNKGLVINEKEQFITSLGLVAEAPASYTLENYVDLLENFGPLWVTVDADIGKGFSPHAVILYGINGDIKNAPDKVVFHFANPTSGNTFNKTFEDFIIYYEQLVTDNKSDSLFVQIVRFSEAIQKGEGSGSPNDFGETSPWTQKEFLSNNRTFLGSAETWGGEERFNPFREFSNPKKEQENTAEFMNYCIWLHKEIVKQINNNSSQLDVYDDILTSGSGLFGVHDMSEALVAMRDAVTLPLNIRVRYTRLVWEDREFIKYDPKKVEDSLWKKESVHVPIAFANYMKALSVHVSKETFANIDEANKALLLLIKKIPKNQDELTKQVWTDIKKLAKDAKTMTEIASNVLWFSKYDISSKISELRIDVPRELDDVKRSAIIDAYNELGDVNGLDLAFKEVAMYAGLISKIDSIVKVATLGEKFHTEGGLTEFESSLLASVYYLSGFVPIFGGLYQGVLEWFADYIPKFRAILKNKQDRLDDILKSKERNPNIR